MTTPQPPQPGQDPQWQQPGTPDPTQQFSQPGQPDPTQQFPQPGQPTEQWQQPPAPGQQWQQPPAPGQQWQQPPAPGQQWQQAGVPVVPAKRKPWLVPVILGVAAVFVLCCGGLFVIGATSDPKPAADSRATSKAPAASAPASAPAAAPTVAKSEAAKPSAEPSPEGPPVFKIGQKVRGGDFEFTVHGVKCGIRSVGTDFLNTKAQGEFCRIDMTAKNVTKSAHLFHADSTVTAQDGSGREYSADGEAGIYGNDNAKGFLDEINPGNSVRAYVFFDVPKGTKLKTITFDAGLFTLAEDAVVTL